MNLSGILDWVFIINDLKIWSLHEPGNKAVEAEHLMYTFYNEKKPGLFDVKRSSLVTINDSLAILQVEKKIKSNE